jgi:hypothetical protein
LTFASSVKSLMVSIAAFAPDGFALTVRTKRVGEDIITIDAEFFGAFDDLIQKFQPVSRRFGNTVLVDRESYERRAVFFDFGRRASLSSSAEIE